MKRKWKVQVESTHPVFVAFNKYISLFIVPLLLFIYVVFFIRGQTLDGWDGVIAGIWILLIIISTLVIGAFFVLNYYWLKWNLNWWKNILLSIMIFVCSSLLFGLILRSLN